MQLQLSELALINGGKCFVNNTRVRFYIQMSVSSSSMLSDDTVYLRPRRTSIFCFHLYRCRGFLFHLIRFVNRERYISTDVFLFFYLFQWNVQLIRQFVFGRCCVAFTVVVMRNFCIAPK